MREHIKAFVSHPVTTLTTALTLIGTSASEAWETIDADLVEFDLGAHHGLMIFGFVNLIRVLPDLVEGFERLVEVKESGL